MRSRMPARVMVLGLSLLVAPGARPDAATKGRMFAGGRSETGVPFHDRKLDDQLDALDFTEPSVREWVYWEGGPKLLIPDHLEEHMHTVKYDRLIEEYLRPEAEYLKQPGKSYAHSMMGTSGVITMPNAFVLPNRTWTVGLLIRDEDFDSAHWPGLYTSLDTTTERIFVNRGFGDNFELGAILHRFDSRITYSNGISTNDDSLLAGFNAKAGIPYQDFWIAVGFSLEKIDDDDRQVLDLRSYDNLQTAYLALTDTGRRWEGTLGFKYIKYGWGGRTPPVGFGPGQPGFSPTDDWTQVGLAFEYGKWGGFSLLAEATKRHKADFLGVPEAEVNVGAKFQAGHLSVKAFTNKQNTDGGHDIGLLGSLRF